MPQFDSLTEAFEWFWENVYPNLPTEKKNSTLRTAKYAYYKLDEKVSTKRMERILTEHAGFKKKYELDIEE